MDTSSPEFQEALRDHAKNLGVDPDGESYLLPLVQEALLAELPPDWEQGETEDGTLYYFNPSTEESIWEHPLDAHYRELIQAKIREHDDKSAAAESTETQASSEKPTSSTTPAVTNADVYSFDDISDEETPTPVVSAVSAAPAANKSRISDLFATPTASMPAKNSAGSTISSFNPTPAATAQPQTTTPASTGFGFGRDRSWLLDNDDDEVTPLKPASTSAQAPLQATSVNSSDWNSSAATSRMNAFSSRRSAASAAPVLTFNSTPATTAIDVLTPLTTMSTDKTSPRNSGAASRQSDSISSTAKGPFYQDNPSQSQLVTPSAPTPSLPSPGTTAKIQQLEKKLADANSDLERERTAHKETTRQLQTAQQDAKESNYLKMKVNELKGKLADQESVASAREKQQLDKLEKQESSASAQEKQFADKLAKLEAENARLVKQQSQTQSEQMEANEKEAQQSRKALENKQKELDELQKRLMEQQQQAKTASDAHEKAKADLAEKLSQQEASAEETKRQHASEIESLREQLDKLEQQLRSSKTTIDEQALKCEQLEKLQQELRTLKSTTDDQAYKGEQLEKLQQELRTLRNTADEHAAAKSEQIEKLQKELRTLKSSADDQVSKFQRLEGVQEDLVREEKLRREIEEKNRTLQSQVDRLERECTELNRKHTGLVQDIDTKKVENAALQSALFKAQDELRTLNSSFEQQRYQQQLTLERERIASDTESQAQSRIQKLQAQLTTQLDEQNAARAKLQAEVLELRGELASIQVQELKPLEKVRDQLQREVERTSERASTLEKDLRTARQELSGQTDRANQMEIEVDVLVRREQQRKAQMDALNTAKITVEKQLDTLQDELLAAQHDKRVDVDKLNFRVRDLESQVSQKEYEIARLEERFAKAETWRSKEAARVEKRDVQLLELQEKLTALQSRHVEVESSAEIQELRAAKQKAEVKIQQLERDLGDERDARKRDEIRRTEDLQRMQQAVEWQLPQLAQACVTRSSDEWARKCRAVAKKLRDELSMRALQERNELVERENKAREASERAEQKLKTTVAESEFLRREVGRLEDNNKVLLEQLHTIRVYLTQRPHGANMSSAPWTWSGQPPPAPNQATATSTAGPLGGPPVPVGGFTDYSTVNQLNTQLGILHAQFQQLFDANDQRRRPQVTTFSPSDRFEIPTSPTGQNHNDEQRREAEEEAEVQRLAMEALMDQKLASTSNNSLNTTGSSSASLHKQQEELLTSLESLGEAPTPQWLPIYSPTPVGGCPNDVENGQEQQPHSTLWYQQNYWRSKYQ